MRTFRVAPALIALAALVAGCSSSGERNAGSTAAGATSSAVASTGAMAGKSTGAMMGSSTGASAPAAASGALVKVATDAKNGTYLTDGSGRALYLFEKDTRGRSMCDSACAAAWPPFTAEGAPTSGDSAVKETMLSTIMRKDGTKQVAYNGKPLYHYAKDSGPGDTKGQDVKEFGAEWYLVSPGGTKQEGKEHD